MKLASRWLFNPFYNYSCGDIRKSVTLFEVALQSKSGMEMDEAFVLIGIYKRVAAWRTGNMSARLVIDLGYGIVHTEKHHLSFP